jgi:hypothetical protein
MATQYRPSQSEVELGAKGAVRRRLEKDDSIF